MLDLTPAKARIFRITHIRNVPWLLRKGIRCRNSPGKDPEFVEIGNPDLIAKRLSRKVPIPPGGGLGDYVPFYFTPHSPMLYNILTGYRADVPRRERREIVIVAARLWRMAELNLPFVFSDRHAYLELARFSSNLEELDRIDWALLRARDFRRDPDDPGKLERYQAEALVHGCVPLEAIEGIACADGASRQRLEQMITQAGVALKVAICPDWYF
jgi:hypothetical protein